MWRALPWLEPEVERLARARLAGGAGEGGAAEGAEGAEEGAEGRAAWLAGRARALEGPLRAAMAAGAVRARLRHAAWEGAPPPGAPPRRYWLEVRLGEGAPLVISPVEHVALALLDPALSRALGDALDDASDEELEEV